MSHQGPAVAAHTAFLESLVGESIIEVTDLVKTYDTGAVRVSALRGISITIERGTMVAIMGPSGCGKTTLLNCASGIDEPSGGRVLIEGTDLSSLDDNARTAYRARRMGFVFQFYNLLPVLSAVENVELPLLVSGGRPRESREKALAALDRVGIRERADHRPAQLSGGERQRATIARALVNNPAIVWAAEPTGDLDSANADAVMGLIEELNRENHQTFVIVTHDPGVASRCHRTIHMHDGLIVREEAAVG